MSVYVDADACPNLHEIELISARYQVACYFYADFHHELHPTTAQAVICGSGSQSVDMALSNVIQKGDILITQDYGLATIGLLRNCKVLHPSGFFYIEETMDQLLLHRHEQAKLRKHGHYQTTKKRTEEIKQTFLTLLEIALKEKT